MTSAKGALATLSIRALSICAQLSFFVLVARASSIEVVGLFAIASAFWVLGRALLPMGWNVAILRLVSVLRSTGETAKGTRVVKVALIDTAILGTAIAAASAAVTLLVSSQHILDVVLASLVAILWAEIGILVAYLRALGDLLWSQLCDGVIIYALPLMVCGAMVASNAVIDFSVIAISYASSALLSLACLVIAVSRKRLVSTRVSCEDLDVRSQRQLAQRLWWNQAFSALSGRASIMLAAPVAGVAATAIVETGLRTQLVGATLAWAGGTVASPRYAVAHENETESGSKILNVVTWAALLPSIAVVAVLGVWGEQILGILGEPYVRERLAITIMALAAVIELPAASGGYFLMMTGRERIANISTVLQLGTLVACIICLGPILGAVGIAVAVLLAAAFRSALVLISLGRDGVLSPISLDGLRTIVRKTVIYLRFGK